MDHRERCAWVALGLGPLSTRRQLLEAGRHARAARAGDLGVPVTLGSEQPPACVGLDMLRAWWSRREAFPAWPRVGRLAQLLDRIERELLQLERRGARALLAFDPDYPAVFDRWPQAPSLLYLWGQLPVSPAVTVVGSRAASADAQRAAERLGRDLCSAGCWVISGGAIGVDAAAHLGALSSSGTTLAVLGSGLHHLYPERHLGLFGRIAERGGVLSPFAPSAPPRRWQFPRRNGLLARLAGVVVVVEAGARSGALITAAQAREAGVPVLARPGSPGTQRLLHQGAGEAASTEEVLRVLAGAAPKRMRRNPEDEDARCALEQLDNGPGLSIDQLSRQLGWGVPRTTVALMRLELGGFVERCPGGRYAAVPRASGG